MISVCMVAYNHDAFIKQAIRGIVSQKTDYPFELIISDDHSSDNTRSICEEMAGEFPSLIRLLPGEDRLGMMPNFIKVATAASGKYIALCDGDDYWCYDNKLQKQLQFLESHPEYAICCHRVYVKKGNQKPKLYADEYMPAKETTYDMEMMARHGNLIASPSVMYRNGLFSAFPSWFHRTPIGDYVLHMMNAQYGKIKYFPEAMAVYRQHAAGAWSGQPTITNALNMIKTLELLLGEQFNDPVREGLQHQLRQNKAIYLRELMKQNWDQFCQEFDKMLSDDKNIAMAMVEKMRSEIDALQGSRFYKAVQRIKKGLRIAG